MEIGSGFGPVLGRLYLPAAQPGNSMFSVPSVVVFNVSMLVPAAHRIVPGPLSVFPPTLAAIVAEFRGIPEPRFASQPEPASVTTGVPPPEPGDPDWPPTLGVPPVLGVPPAPPFPA